MTIKLRGANRERLSYRTLDVEQIGSVYETVMGFTVEPARTRVLAIKAGKNNKTPVFVALDELLAKKGKERIKSLCGPDKASLRFGVRMKCRDRMISLERLLSEAGFNPKRLDEKHTTKWLNRVLGEFVLEEGTKKS